MNKLILALSIGDGYLSKDGTLSILHSEKQEEYLRYKATLLNSEDRVKFKCNNHKFPAFEFQKGTYNKYYGGKEIRKKLYGVMKHKYFSKTIVDELDKFCMAILYCDDGSLIPQKRNGKIHAYNLTISIYASFEECERLSERIFELFGVTFRIGKDKGKYLLRCGTKEARKFIPQIKKILPDFECFKDNKLKFPF